MSLMMLFLKWKTNSLNRNKGFFSSLYSVFTYLKRVWRCEGIAALTKECPPVYFSFLFLAEKQISHASTNQNLNLWVFDCNRSAAEWMRKKPTFVLLNGWNKEFVLLKSVASPSVCKQAGGEKRTFAHPSVCQWGEKKKSTWHIFLKTFKLQKPVISLDSSSILWRQLEVLSSFF